MTGLRGEWLGRPWFRAVLLAVLVGVGLIPVLTSGSWLGSWKVALDSGIFSVTLLGPAAAGIACTVYARIRRAGFDDLLASSSRPWLGWVAPAAGVWLLAVLALLIICAVTTATSWWAGSRPYPELSWVLLPTAAVLAAQVGLGALVGARSGQYWAAPWAAIATFGLFILSSIEVIPVVFRTGGTTGDLAGETFYVPTFGYQAVVAVGCAAVALALSHRTLFGLASLLWRGTTVVAAGAAAVALVVLDPSGELYAVDDSTGLACVEGRPTVCLLEDAARPLDDLAAQMQALATHLETAGATVPDRFAVPLPGGRTDPGVGFIHLVGDERLAATVGPEAAARSLTKPTDCPAYSSDDPRALPESWFAVAATLERWLLVQEGDAAAPTDGRTARWWALSAHEQHPWVRATYDALRDCRLDDLRLPR